MESHSKRKISGEVMTKFAITAASGQLGAEIVRALTRSFGNQHVIALARNPVKAKSLEVEVRPGDYRSPGELELALTGVDKLLLVSGMAPPEERIQQHRNVIAAARNAGVKTIVYTSIQGADSGTGFSEVVQSNRQTEEDIRNSGLAWVIGRNGLYIEPDVEYVTNYISRGEIANSAGSGKCGYTTRAELAFAYAQLLSEPKHAGNTYNLHGELMQQAQLAGYLGTAFGAPLRYRPVSSDEYRQDRIAELGDFLGTIIAGIYEGIAAGAMENESQFAMAAGRPHMSWQEYFSAIGAEVSG